MLKFIETFLENQKELRVELKSNHELLDSIYHTLIHNRSLSEHQRWDLQKDYNRIEKLNKELNKKIFMKCVLGVNDGKE